MMEEASNPPAVPTPRIINVTIHSGIKLWRNSLY